MSGSVGPLFLQLATNNASAADLLEEAVRAAIQPHRGTYLGPVLLGSWLDLIGWGLMAKQLLTWWQYAVEDEALVQILVLWCSIWGSVGTVFHLAYLFHVFVYNFGIYESFAVSTWGSWLGVIGPFPIAGVQVFYTYRAYVLTRKNKLMAGAILLLIISSIVGGVGSKIVTKPDSYRYESPDIQAFIFLFICSSVAANVLITGVIMWCLGKSKSGWKATDKLVNKLSVVAVETQLAPTIVAIAFLVFYTLKVNNAPNSPSITSNLTAFFMMLLPKTYIVGFLAVLNSRTSLMAVASTSHDVTDFEKKNGFELRKRPLDRGQIKITTDTYVHASSHDTASPLQDKKSKSPKLRLADIMVEADEETVNDDLEYYANGSKTALTSVDGSQVSLQMERGGMR